MPQKDRIVWTAFDWAAWLSDPVVRLMTHEQRGRYIDFLALSNQTQTPGAHTEHEVMRMLGYEIAEWRTARHAFVRAFKILEAQGDGQVWVQQRTVAEHQKSVEVLEKRRVAGKSGATARWQTHANGNASALANGCTVRSRSRLDSTSASNEASVESKKPTPLSPASRDDEVGDFFKETLWPTYPNKRSASKADALKALIGVARAYKGDLDDLATEIMAGLKRHMVHWARKENEFVPHPATWIRQRRWEDNT